jgi:stress response protein YsnF/sporulation protein YlmC with PRC-barrel domain
MTQQTQDILALRGKDLIGRDGDKLGTIEEIYLDGATDQPHWALVTTGMFGTKQSFVPISGAIREGNSVRVTFGKATVKDAPKIDPDGRLSDREEAELCRHYGMNHGGEDSGSGHDTSGPTTDDAMTRSEEELEVGARERESGRVRLKKYVVEDEVTETVPVRHEEPVLAKQAVPKERVRLDKEAHSDERQVSETLRKEQTDVDDAQGSR